MPGINTNTAALFNQATLRINLQQNAATIEKLSSGLRVNSAKDDAAGLALVTRLSARINGSDLAMKNIQGSRSMMEIADGASATISDNLQRMRELAVQASNGTLTDTDRANLNREYQSLAQENQRIVDTTRYNGIRVFGDQALNTSAQIGSQSGDRQSFSLEATNNNPFLGSTTGSIDQIFQNSTVTVMGPDQLNNSNPGVASVAGNPAAYGTFGITVNQLQREYIYRGNVGAGNPMDFGVPGMGAMNNNSNPAVATANGTPAAGIYNINVNTIATNYLYRDNVGAGNPTYGIQSRSFAVDNSNPAVATATAAQDSNTNYNLTVNQLAQGQVNVINGVVGTNGSNDTSGGLGNQPSRNEFRINFGNGDQINFNLANGQYTTAQFVNAFNTAAAGRVTASYNAAAQTLTYTQNSTGTNNSFQLENRSRTANALNIPQAVGSFAPANVFETNAGNTTQTAQNATGNVNGTAFNSQSNNAITVAAAGAGNITFNSLTTGNTVIQQRQASQNTFRIDFGDGTPSANFSVGSGNFTVNDYISAFNTAAAGKFTASYNAATGDITYTGLEDGANKTLSVVNTSQQVQNGTPQAVPGSNPFNSADATTLQTGTNFTGDVNGTAFNDADGQNIAVGGINFDALSVGSTTIERVNPVGGSINSFTIGFGDGTADATFSLANGEYSAMDFVNAFNAAQNKFVASYSNATGQITYAGLEDGADETFTITNNSVGDAGEGDIFENTVVLQNGQNFQGSITDGTSTVNFDNKNGQMNAFGFTATGQSVGSTTLTFSPGAPMDVNVGFGDILTKNASDNALQSLDSYVDTFSDFRALVGSNLSRIDAIELDLRSLILNYQSARSRIEDLDFALETAKKVSQDIRLQSNIAFLAQNSQRPANVLNLLASR